MKVCEIVDIRFHRPIKAVGILIIFFKIKILSATPEKNYFLSDSGAK